jgi:hypothetical protein
MDMDILDIIAENIEARNEENIIKLLNHFIDTVKNKSLFNTFIIKFFSAHYIDKNLWFLKKIVEYLCNIESNKNNVIGYQNICILLMNNNFKNMNLFKKGEVYNDNTHIEKLLHGFHKEYEDMMEFKDIMTNECYALFNILYRNIIHCCELSDCFTIIRYLITRKKRELFKTIDKNCIIDNIFTVVIKFLQANDRIADDIREYIILCKDIYYYNCKQKDKIDRINILFYTIFIIIQRKVKYQKIKYILPKEISYNKCNHSNLFEYLFVLIKYDNDIINIVRNDREFSKLVIKTIKTINIDNYNDRDKCSVDIIKLST